jgi:HAD superfamily hydrolase (TIGR01509 family)
MSHSEAGTAQPRSACLASIEALLLDADGTLFPSEELAFQASAVITRQFADEFGLVGDFTAEHLRRTSTGKNFRTTAQELLAGAGLSADAAVLQSWISREEQAVTAYLGQHLRPNAEVLRALSELRATYPLAAVSSSGLGRLAASFSACGLDDLIPPNRRFSAENSLPVPISKPDPAIYQFALRAYGLRPTQALAVEDSVTGARSAVRAGIATIGIVEFVPEAERVARTAELRDAGALTVVESWADLRTTLLRASEPSDECPRRSPTNSAGGPVS